MQKVYRKLLAVLEGNIVRVGKVSLDYVTLSAVCIDIHIGMPQPPAFGSSHIPGVK
jgi:hypothetical protein